MVLTQRGRAVGWRIRIQDPQISSHAAFDKTLKRVEKVSYFLRHLTIKSPTSYPMLRNNDLDNFRTISLTSTYLQFIL